LTVSSLIVQPRAQVDIDEALAWYHEQDPKLAQRLLVELDLVFERICHNPLQFPVVADPVQRALLRKFPYSVYFVAVGSRAAVVAVVHQKRRPVEWRLATLDRVLATADERFGSLDEELVGRAETDLAKATKLGKRSRRRKAP
jgi:plasmid stabilization system protein ParE